jgi:hypothetical protein
MSLNVGALWVRTGDRDRVVELIREYWNERGAQPTTTDPLQISPLSIDESGQLGFAVAPPATAAGPVEADAPLWVTVYDSQRYTADSELAAHLAQVMGVPVVVAEFSGSVDIATIEVFGEGGPEVPRSGKPKHWDAVENFVLTQLPFPFVYFNQLHQVEAEELANWVIFGYERVPYRKKSDYSGPSPDEEERQRRAASASELAAQGDTAGLRALWRQYPDFRDKLVSDLDRDVEDETKRRVYLEFAEEILAARSYWLVNPLAEAAHRIGDIALFERACAVLGHHVSSLEMYGHELAQAGRYDEAVQVLGKICSGPDPSVTSFNNLAHCLTYHSDPMPALTGHWLTEADARGAANPHILHNSACAWLRIGDRERAIAAVESAVRYGYPLIDRVRTDEDLRAVHDDPRFQAAFDREFHFSDLTVTAPFRSETVVVARPLLTMRFFVEAGPGARVGEPLAAVVRAYLDDVPSGVLSTRSVGSDWGLPLSKSRIDKDLERLRTAGQYKWRRLAYRGATDDAGGSPTPYGVDVALSGRDRYDEADVPISWVRLLFPAVECYADPEAVAARFRRYAELVPFTAGGCGLELVTRDSSQFGSWWSEELLQGRDLQPLGFEHHPMRQFGHGAPGPTWLTLLGPGLAADLGLTDPSTVVGPTATAVGNGLCLRAATYPPLGLDRADVGTLPTIARLLRPRRLDRPAGHYARFDELPDGPYQNRPPRGW